MQRSLTKFLLSAEHVCVTETLKLYAFRTIAHKEAFRLLFDTYHMKLCIYAVQLTDSFEMAEDIVQDFFIYFWEKKYYLKINQNLHFFRRVYHNAVVVCAASQKNDFDIIAYHDVLFCRYC